MELETPSNTLPRASLQTSSPGGPTARVLVVEDDACVSLLLKNLLQKENYQVQHCSSGEAALEILGRDRFDAVVLDLMMPGIDGLQVLKNMRTLPAHAFTPVIITTAARLKLVEEEALRFGARFYLDKSQHQRLLEGLRQIMSERAASPAPKLRMVSSPGGTTQAGASPAVRPQETAPGENDGPKKGLRRFFS